MTSDDGAAVPEVVLVLITSPDEEAGRALVRRLVNEGLIACGNVIPGLTSVYRWEGEVQEDSEALLLLKTTSHALPEVKRRVLELHSYEVPEFLALPVTEGSERYLRWVIGEVRSRGDFS
jgi:periplasmic divalent cation tolerance protein